MGITIAYRGRLADLTNIEDFEDRLLDFALEVGGMAQIWRSQADDSMRMVRGVILNLAPGQESTSLLVSPEGWLIGLTDIKDAELGRLKDPPWCFVKTQFGPVEGHVALVEMFSALKREFLPDLEVRDEGGYWETRDFAELTRRCSFLQKAIDGLAKGLQRHGLSREAAEDPEIVLRRIERVAAQVHRVLQRPAEHPPVQFPDDDEYGGEPDLETTEALWDEMFKHNRRQQERMQRALEERQRKGEDDESAFENAMRDIGIGVPGDEESGPGDEPRRYDEEEPFGGSLSSDAEPEEPGIGGAEVNEASFGADDEERHPLLKKAMDLLHDLHTLFRDEDSRFTSSLQTLYQGAGDAMGGLAQALGGTKDDDPDDYGLRIVQLKRALRGVAFARGALFPLRPAVTAQQFDELFGTLDQMEKDIFQELGRVRAEHPRDDL
jgi:hypothetical protein